MKIVIFLVSCLLGLNSTRGHEDGHHNGFNKVPHNDNKMLEDMSEDVAEQDYEDENNSTWHAYTFNNTHVMRDENHPLLSLKRTDPHSMELIIRPQNPKTITMIRLLYERVPRNKAPLMLHLDDPVVELFKFKPRNGAAMPKTLSDLPMGKYIVCGEARIESQVHQSNCFETLIERLEPDTLQVGVQVIIVVSIVLVIFVIFYAILYQMCKKNRCSKKSMDFE